MKLLIDGENFRHQIAGVLAATGRIKDSNSYFRFDFAGFCAEVLGDKPDITYYTTKIKRPRQKVPKRLDKQIDAILSANRRWIAQLTNQKIRVVKAGYLRVRESNACVHCGKTTLVLQEKGVDVRVSTDLLLASRSQGAGPVAVASSDSDIVPALEASRLLGAKITYVCYAGRLNRSVAAQADKTVTFDDQDIIKYFKND